MANILYLLTQNQIEIKECLQTLKSKNDRDIRPLGVPLFSGDLNNDKLSASDRQRIENNCAVFAEKITVALKHPSYTPSSKIRELHFHVRGSAHEQLLTMPQDGRPGHTFKDLLDALVWTFQPAELPGDLLTEITQLEQGPEETMDAYHIKLLRKSNNGRLH